MVRNIIADSDDEGDLGSLSPVASRQSPPAPAQPTSEKTPTRSQKSLPGTGSTEELRREIAAAHKDVIDRSAAPNGSTDSQDSTAHWDPLAGSRKRKSTLSSLDVQETPRPKRVDTRKSEKTYGQSSWTNYSLYDEGGDAYNAMRLDEAAQTEGNAGVIGRLDEERAPTPALTEYLATNHQATPPKMPSSLRDNFVGHEPAVMFPMSMSSTVPDATADQQRLLDAARAEQQHDEGLGSPKISVKHVPNPFVSWSDTLEENEKAMLSSNSRIGRSQQRSQGNNGRSQSLEPTESCEAVSQPSNIGDNPAPQIGSSNAVKRSKTTPYPQSSHDDLGEHDELGEEPPLRTNVASSRQGRSSRSKGSPTKSERIVEESIQESIRAVRAAKEKKAQDAHVGDALNSDDVSIGLPKERYIPRPSRSRSVRSSADEPDYSVLPEKAAKQKPKRRKTVDVIAAHDHESSHPEPAFSKTDSAPAKAASAVLSAEVSLPASEQAQGNAPAPKRKRGRPPKKRKESSKPVLDEQPASVAEDQVDEASQLHQAIASAPSAGEDQGKAESVSQSEQLLHDPDFKDDGLRVRRPSPVVQPSPASSAQADGGMQQVEEPTRRRRGRGRPRSTPNSARGGAATDDVDELQAATGGSLHDENEKSHEIQSDTGLGDGESPDFQEAEEGAQEAALGNAGKAAPMLGPSGSPQEPSEEHEVGTNQKAAAKAKGGSAEPSPLGKGKVPLRVGLSRRARIAPLLKIVKK